MGEQGVIESLAADLGFALVGVAPAAPTAYRDYVRRWLDRGNQGEMSYLERHAEQRLDPRVLVPGARSVVCVADRHQGGKADGPTETGGRIARYAWGDDYHRIIKRRLHRLADRMRSRWPDDQHRAAVDTAPILEREHALRAGMGWIGKHTLLIHPTLGSYLLLGEIVTTRDLAPAGAAMADHCGTCTRCIDACPTGCIEEEGYRMDASRCISYLTIEHRGPIDADLQAQMGDWVAGCDVCQEVCPYNQEDRVSLIPSNPSYDARFPAPAVPLLELLDWDADQRRAAFKGSALKRIKLDPLRRNALIAAGNHLARTDDPALRAKILAIAEDMAEPSMIRETARQVLGRLGE
ncbi:MAG: tRNA epoxyqueuosine(34) reductase QueG [Phycisphaeraceae bacterium]|nr:tRNA epoxyqueuosine(34) reductase QueG [Phycisphaeraceae bacterium]